jgi:hypothetical protein
VRPMPRSARPERHPDRGRRTGSHPHRCGRLQRRNVGGPICPGRDGRACRGVVSGAARSAGRRSAVHLRLAGESEKVALPACQDARSAAADAAPGTHWQLLRAALLRVRCTRPSGCCDLARGCPSSVDSTRRVADRTTRFCSGDTTLTGTDALADTTWSGTIGEGLWGSRSRSPPLSRGFTPIARTR